MGADPNAVATGTAPSGLLVRSTPLIAAVGHGQLETARLLLDAGADPVVVNDRDGLTSLMAAAGGAGHLAVLRLLLEHLRADVAMTTFRTALNVADPVNGMTAFHIACHNEKWECAEVLVREGCDVGVLAKNDMVGTTGWQVRLLGLGRIAGLHYRSSTS
jgi:ankyrin repeat protein